ncbi:MAG: pyridoxal-dependent decarboxylase [Ginsengibacter sp.]
MNPDLESLQRKEAWEQLTKKLEMFYANPYNRKVSPQLNAGEIKKMINTFSETLSPGTAIAHVLEGMEKYTVHTSHPMYYGLFNPRANFPSITADIITAVYNPQLAAWSHSPFAAEVEQMLIKSLGKKFGYLPEDIDGVFTSGGAEANLTALLTALNNKYPAYANEGILSLKKQPVIYCSNESHHSIIKAVKIAGLGINAVRKIPVNHSLQPLINEFDGLIREDISNGFEPLMLIATLGTTGAGIVEPIKDLAPLATKYSMWLHADAAYGGGAILSQQYKYLVDGIELSDSITFDAHKWMSVTMSASIFLTRHKGILDKTFRITADYMPKEAGTLDITDPFTHSIQWSRRFIGLKLYLSLLIFGWKGYEETIDQHFSVGKLLRKKLAGNGWVIFNDTDLPVICFGKENFIKDEQAALKLSNQIIQSGKAWLSVYKLGDINTLRVCITNYLTGEKDIDDLLILLDEHTA